MSNSVQMCGWLSDEIARASRSKRARYTFYEVGGCQAPADFSGFLCREATPPLSRRSEPLIRTGLAAAAIITGHHQSFTPVRRPVMVHALLAASVSSSPFGSDVPSIRVSATNGTKHPKLVLEAWRRGPPSRPRFRRGTRSIRRGRAPARAPRRVAATCGRRCVTLSPPRPPECPRSRHSATRRSAVCARGRQCQSAATADCRGQTAAHTSA